jgi:hypothetical protein
MEDRFDIQPKPPAGMFFGMRSGAPPVALATQSRKAEARYSAKYPQHITKEAPLGSLLVALLLGVAVAWRR